VADMQFQVSASPGQRIAATQNTVTFRRHHHWCNANDAHYCHLRASVQLSQTEIHFSRRIERDFHKYLPSKNFTDYTTALHRVVFHAPKLIKLGSKGSSTKRCGAVKKFKYTKKSKFPKKSQKIKIFKKFKTITKMTARALVITFKCNNFFPIKIGQEKMEIFTKSRNGNV
jgi:hypothetical protein